MSTAELLFLNQAFFSGPAPNTVLKADIRVLVIVDISEENPRGRFASGHSDQLVPFAASTENIM
jgi:hypothetical protein